MWVVEPITLSERLVRLGLSKFDASIDPPLVAPAPTKALYFVARGDGSSEFSASLEDHNRAVNKFQRKQ